jgi:hypothetical protein
MLQANICFDRTFGHLVRVLVDLNLIQELIKYKVFVERKWFAFFVEMDYENLSNFYIHFANALFIM